MIGGGTTKNPFRGGERGIYLGRLKIAKETLCTVVRPTSIDRVSIRFDHPVMNISGREVRGMGCANKMIRKLEE